MKKLVVLLITISALAFVAACDSQDGDGCDPGPQDEIAVTGPITGGKFNMPWMTAWEDLEKRGYVEEEFFFEGEAASYVVDGEQTTDGMWTVSEVDKAPFKSRMLVRRPKDAKDFNGTVIVEWFNVSGQVDAGPGWMFNEPLLTREGFAWVGVDAQKQGADGTGILFLKPLAKWDPERYGSISHPGDGYAYDIFTQAAKVIRGEGSMAVLGGLKAERVIAYGESQSAGTMVTYTNAVHPIAKVFDGIFIHSRGSGGHPLGDVSMIEMGCEMLSGDERAVAKIRTDLDVPVMQFQTETDALGFIPARQPDTDKIRTWEVPGTAHADYYLASCIMNPEVPDNQPTGVGIFYCEEGNRGPQYIVLRSALKHLDTWIKDGIAPPKADPIETDNMKAVVDEFGNALGGIRTPFVDVPIAKYTTFPVYENPSEMKLMDMACGIFGGTAPFTPEQLIALYPTHEDYVEKFTQSAQATMAAGFMLAEEGAAIIKRAQSSPIPFEYADVYKFGDEF